MGAAALTLEGRGSLESVIGTQKLSLGYAQKTVPASETEPPFETFHWGYLAGGAQVSVW